MAISEKSSPIDNVVAQIEGLTKIQRILISIVTLVLIVGAFFWLSYMPKWQDIKNLRAEHKKLEVELKKSKKNAARLPEVQKQFEMKRREYIAVMKSLPEKEEISNLLTSISRSGQDSGLEFMLFQPGADVNRNFYAEIPVSMRVSGGYHSVATFFDKVAKLSRIVNIKNIQIVQAKGDLSTSCTAVTYKFLENQPQSNPTKKN